MTDPGFQRSLLLVGRRLVHDVWWQFVDQPSGLVVESLMRQVKPQPGHLECPVCPSPGLIQGESSGEVVRFASVQNTKGKGDDGQGAC